VSAPAGPRTEHFDCGLLADLEDGGMTLVEGPHGGIGLFRRGDTVYALRNWCPHNGAPVCLGPVTGTNVSKGGHAVEHVRDGEILVCPWHKWEFELATGESITKPVKKVETYPVIIEDGRVSVVVRRIRKRRNADTTHN
jgi:nitrite reductase/ring-hydroxylating ferredoxin subunit